MNSTAKSAGVPLNAETFVNSLSEILSFPASHIIIFSFDEVADGDFDVVIGFRDYNGLSGSTISQVLQETGEEEFIKYGLSNIRLEFNDANSIYVDELHVESLSAVTSAGCILGFSVTLLILLVLLF